MLSGIQINFRIEILPKFHNSLARWMGRWIQLTWKKPQIFENFWGPKKEWAVVCIKKVFTRNWPIVKYLNYVRRSSYIVSTMSTLTTALQSRSLDFRKRFSYVSTRIKCILIYIVTRTYMVTWPMQIWRENEYLSCTWL